MIAYVTELTNDNFNEFTKDSIVLVDVKAEWCSPCHALSPIIDEISAEFLGKLSVGKMDVDSCSTITAELGIRNIPALILYKNGEIVERIIGLVSKQKIIETINSHL